MSREFQCMHVESKKIIPLCTGSALEELMQTIFPKIDIVLLCEDAEYPVCRGTCLHPLEECLPLFTGECECISKCKLSILCS